MKFLRKHFCFCLLFVGTLFSGCKDKNEIKVYRVSKAEPEALQVPDFPVSAPKNADLSGMPSTDAGSPSSPVSQITGIPPADWEAQPLTSMRQASYRVKGDNGTTVDISLVLLAGSAGGVLENINRWLSQLGQPAITTEQLSKMARTFSSPLGDVTLVDFQGLPQGADATKDGRIVAGIISSDNGSFFFKMRGNAALAGSQKEAFIRWIGTVRTTGGGASAVQPPPTGSPDSVATATPSADPDKPQIKWEVPVDWKTAAPSAMRYASFSIDGQDGKAADISVSVFGGNGGGDLDNVNRWRTQAGLAPIGAGELRASVVPVSCKDGEILTVDLTGPEVRILAGWARIDGKSWFFKLIAPPALAEASKAGFVKFLQSVQFHP